LLISSVRQENAGAQYNLGNMYDFGKGVLKDAKQAASWYQKAAEQGYAKAMLIRFFIFSPVG
jgi:TPR repeat protein